MNWTNWILFCLLVFECLRLLKDYFSPKSVTSGIYGPNPANWRFFSSFNFIIPKSLDNRIQLTSEVPEIMKAMSQEENTPQPRKDLFNSRVW